MVIWDVEIVRTVRRRGNRSPRAVSVLRTEVVVVLWLLLACGGEPEAVDGGAAEPVVEIDSPFCPSFESCMEGLPRWGAECDRWHAGDPDCAEMDWSAGPADWIDQTHRGIAALLHSGRAPEPEETKVRSDVPATTRKASTRKE